MLIKKIKLPFFGMQEGEENSPEKSRNDLFIEGLGLSQEVRDQISNNEISIQDAVKGFQTSYSSLLQQQHLSNWDEEKRSALIKETQTGSHNAIQGKLLKTFELDAEAFKDVDKKTEAILVAAKENYEKRIAELNSKLDSKTDATSKQLQEQLDLRNSEFKTLAEELEALRKFKEEFPIIKEDIITQERNNQWASLQIASAADSIQNKNAAASLNMINLLISQVAEIKVSSDENGNKSISILDKRTNAPFMRSATDNYKDLTTFISEEILKKNKLINLQNPPSSNGIPSIVSTQKGKKKNAISSRAADRAK